MKTGGRNIRKQEVGTDNVEIYQKIFIFGRPCGGIYDRGSNHGPDTTGTDEPDRG